MNAMLEREWRIVHIAGHGEPPETIGAVPVNPGDPPQRDGDPRGVVLSNGTFLGPREINTMRVVPELVFVNCCHLAARNIGQLLEPGAESRYDRAAFAAGVAEELIRIGVRCVVAAGWAVDDEPAKTFATTFYDHLLAGKRFLDAIAEARLAAYALGGNTWAAYQCYGDPDWTFRWATIDAQTPSQSGAPIVTARPSSNVSAEFSAVASMHDLTLALDTLATSSRYTRVDANEQRRKIGYLQDQFAGHWGERGEVAESFGNAFREADDRISAIAWYQRAVLAADGTASTRALGNLANLRARVALEMTDKARRRVDVLTRKGAKAREISAARKVLTATIDKARREIDWSRAQLEPLAMSRPSAERVSLCGSTWKRRAMIERIAGDTAAEIRATRQMKRWYERAETIARDHKDPLLYYPGLNRIAAELIVDAVKPGWPGFDSEALEAVRDVLDTKTRDDPDFWSVTGRTELRLYESLARRDLGSQCPGIKAEYDDLWARVRAYGDWDSANTQLRFVLPKYIERASKAEQAAAADLMDHVRRLAARAKRAGAQAS
jgi:hypothetical protein